MCSTFIYFFLLISLISHSRARFEYVLFKKYIRSGQFDSSESPERPEITEIIENFTKVTKDLTKLKDTLENYVWGKSHFKKQ